MEPFIRLKELNTKECLWIYILSILKSKPMHGYALRKEVENKFSFRPGNVTSYKVLYLLKKSGYVSKKNDGRLVVYSITTKGKTELKKAIRFYRELAMKMA